jgi:hypothetical protein
VPYAKHVVANFASSHLQYTHFCHNLDSFLGSNVHVVDALDKVVSGIVDAHWGYSLDPQHLHMLGIQSSHLLCTPCKQFAPMMAIVDAKVVPARGGGQFQHLLLAWTRAHGILPPVGVSPPVLVEMTYPRVERETKNFRQAGM